MSEPYTGGCACGAIRYRITAEPAKSGHCQCRDCQRITGTGHASLMIFPRAAVTLTGAPKFFEVTADSGNRTRRAFCPDCGAFLFALSGGNPNTMAVTAGSLDDPARFVPQIVAYTASGQDWDRPDPGLPAFPRMPTAAAGPHPLDRQDHERQPAPHQPR